MFISSLLRKTNEFDFQRLTNGWLIFSTIFPSFFIIVSRFFECIRLFVYITKNFQGSCRTLNVRTMNVCTNSNLARSLTWLTFNTLLHNSMASSNLDVWMYVDANINQQCSISSASSVFQAILVERFKYWRAFWEFFRPNRHSLIILIAPASSF